MACTQAPGPNPAREGGAWRGRRIALLPVIVLVAACGVWLWAQVVRESLTPVNEWLRALRHGSADQRQEAAGMLGSLTAQEVSTALPALIAALRDDDEHVVLTVVRSLGLAGGAALKGGDRASADAAVQALVAALKKPGPALRTAAAEALADVAGSGPLDFNAATSLAAELTRALNDPVAEVRSAVVIALGAVGSRNLIPPPGALIATLDGDPFPRVREMAAQSIGRFQTGRDQATLALFRGLETGQTGVRKSCDSALSDARFAKGERRTAQIAPELTRALNSRERTVRSHAATVLGEIGPGASVAIPALLGLLVEPEDPERGRSSTDRSGWDPACEAARALSEVAQGSPRAAEVVAALTAVIRGPGPGLRRAMAADALARFAPKQLESALPVLVEVLNETVGNIGPPAPAVCATLGRVAPGTPQAGAAVAALTAALHSGSEYSRSEAAKALARFGCGAESALPRLRALAESDRVQIVRDNASEAVARLEEAAGKPEPK
jgi:HEAT repeat protein